MQNLIIILAVLFAAYMINQKMISAGFSIMPLMSHSLGIIPLVMDNNGSERVSSEYAGSNPSAQANAAAANALAALAANNAILSMPGEVNLMQIPMALTYLNVSSNAGGTVATYFMNNDTYNAAATNNGGGADTIVNTYGDGFTGKSYNQLARSLANGMGIKCYGLTMHYVTTTTGAENSAGLTSSTPTLLYYTGAGTAPVPKPIIMNVGARNSQQLAGEMTVKMIFYINSTFQMSYNVTNNTTLSLTVMTQPLA